MARKEPFHIDASLYEGRTFSPIIETTRARGEGPVDTPAHPEGANELVCITFVAPTTPGSTVNLKVGINPEGGWVPENAADIGCMASITEKNGDFSRNAMADKTGGFSLQGIVGPATRTQVGLEPGKTYIANAAPYNRGEKAGIRVQLTIG